VKLLLDTHIWIWSLLEPARIAPRVAKALENPANEKWLSPISIWECMVLVGKGRVKLNMDVEEWLAMSKIHLAHRDPADAFLAATAKVFQLTLVTVDTRLRTAKGISFL
jgi:PIN domain nuclease of toxin-antitoxin system